MTSEQLYLDCDAGIAFEETWLYANSGVLYAFPLKNNPKITPYVAGGGGIMYFSAEIFGISVSTTDFKLNAGGGVKFQLSDTLRARADFRFYFIEGTYERIAFGMEFSM